MEKSELKSIQIDAVRIHKWMESSSLTLPSVSDQGDGTSVSEGNTANGYDTTSENEGDNYAFESDGAGHGETDVFPMISVNTEALTERIWPTIDLDESLASPVPPPMMKLGSSESDVMIRAESPCQQLTSCSSEEYDVMQDVDQARGDCSPVLGLEACEPDSSEPRRAVGRSHRKRKHRHTASR